MDDKRKPFFVELPLDLHHALVEFTHDRYLADRRRHTQREVVLEALRTFLDARQITE